MNHKKNPGQFTTLMGMTRGLSANRDYKNVLKYAIQALAIAPGQQAKTQVETMIQS